MDEGAVLRHPDYDKLLSKRKREIRPALEAAVRSMVRNVKDFATPKYTLDKKGKRIGYEGKDGIDYYTLHYNKTLFAYLNEEGEGEGKLPREDVAKHLALDLVCGRFSFAEMPMDYRCILGVRALAASQAHRSACAPCMDLS